MTARSSVFGRTRSRTRRGLAGVASLGVLGVALCSAPPASAQTVPTTLYPAPFSLTPRGDLGYVPPVSGFRLAAPIRLSLEGSVIPVAGGFPNCGDQNEVGNSVGGIPVQHYAEWQLTRRLLLSTFTQLGCPIDAGIGAAVTYTVPLRPSMALVFAGGAYAAPGQFQLFGGLPSSLKLGLLGARSPLPVSARADIVWNTQKGNPLNLGVQSLGLGRQQVMFGGGF